MTFFSKILILYDIKETDIQGADVAAPVIYSIIPGYLSFLSANSIL